MYTQAGPYAAPQGYPGAVYGAPPPAPSAGSFANASSSPPPSSGQPPLLYAPSYNVYPAQNWGESSQPPPPQPAYVGPVPVTYYRPPSPKYAPQSCCGPSIIPTIRDVHTTASTAIRAVASAAVGLGVLGIIYCGWTMVSSILLLSTGAVLHRATRTPAQFAAFFAEVQVKQGSGNCCRGRRPQNSKRLAIAALVFAVLELCLGIGLGFGLGGAQIDTPVTKMTMYNSGAYYTQVCNLNPIPTCITGPKYNATYGTSTWRRPLDLYDSTMIGSGGYLLYAGGATVIMACVNITLCAVLIALVNLVIAIHMGSAEGSAPAASEETAIAASNK